MVSPPQTLYASSAARPVNSQPTTLVDLIDRVLSGGVVVAGHITLAVAEIDLIELDLALIVAATAKLAER